MHLFNAALLSPYLKDRRDTREYVVFKPSSHNANLHHENTFLEKIEVLFVLDTLSLNIYIYIYYLYICIEAIYCISCFFTFHITQFLTALFSCHHNLYEQIIQRGIHVEWTIL